jgi:quercetin dioxygenase-like cupin family protein
MQLIQPLASFSIPSTPEAPANGKAVHWLCQHPGQQVFEILLAPNETLKRHTSTVPITIFCLAGQGQLLAGDSLTESAPLAAGSLFALPANVPHEIHADATLHLLVSKFG